MLDLNALSMQRVPQGRGGDGLLERIAGEGFADLLQMNAKSGAAFPKLGSRKRLLIHGLGSRKALREFHGKTRRCK